MILRTGRLNSLDSFTGDEEDPYSLHKYVYAHANPVTFVDPTGLAAVPGYVYDGVGTKVHWIFSAYALIDTVPPIL